MRVLVTGASGFIGRQLVRQLICHSVEVVATDNQVNDLPSGVIALPGDLGDEMLRRRAKAANCDAVIHLATVAGAAAELDPALSRRVNVDAMYDLLLDLCRPGRSPRVVFASSIAVFGDPWPPHVDDHTPLAPKMIYGGHKAMMEQAVAMFSHRRMIDGISLRLPGIVARPRASSTMKSAFISDLFHSLRAGQPFTSPVSATGTMWLESLACVVENIMAALHLDSAGFPTSRAVTLPALRVSMADLGAEVARQCGVSTNLISYAADPALEAAFAAQPPLSTDAAEALGLRHDGTLEKLVSRAMLSLV